MTRAFVYLSALVGVGGMVYLAGRTQAQAPAAGAPAPAARPAGGKVSVFNVAKVMRDYQRWQYFAGQMNLKRAEKAKELGAQRAAIADLQAKMQNEPLRQKQEEMAKQLVEMNRQFEDKERTIRKQLDDESAAHLRQLFGEIQQCVKAIVDTNGFDLVMAYPDAITPEEMTSPLYYDLKMRPPAAMPFFVAPSADMTDVLIQTLNANFKPPAAAAPQPQPPILPTGGK